MLSGLILLKSVTQNNTNKIKRGKGEKEGGIIRGIRYLTDQISLINPDPMVYLKSLYSNRFSKNWKLAAQGTSTIYEFARPQCWRYSCIDFL